MTEFPMSEKAKARKNLSYALNSVHALVRKVSKSGNVELMSRATEFLGGIEHNLYTILEDGPDAEL